MKMDLIFTIKENKAMKMVNKILYFLKKISGSNGSSKEINHQVRDYFHVGRILEDDSKKVGNAIQGQIEKHKKKSGKY